MAWGSLHWDLVQYRKLVSSYFFQRQSHLSWSCTHQHQIQAAPRCPWMWQGGEYTRVLKVGRYIPQEEQQQEPEQEQPNQVFHDGTEQQEHGRGEGTTWICRSGKLLYFHKWGSWGFPPQRSLSRLSDYVPQSWSDEVGCSKTRGGPACLQLFRCLIDTPAEYTKHTPAANSWWRTLPGL